MTRPGTEAALVMVSIIIIANLVTERCFFSLDNRNEVNGKRW